MKLRVLPAILLLCVAAFPQRRQDRSILQPPRGLRGAVATGGHYAAEAGMRLFHQGGNAVDAGVAATLAAAVTEYSHFGFGGEAPILVRTADGKVHSIAGVGTMPKAATADYFRKRKLRPGEILQVEPGGVKGMIPAAGLMPALVPGMVDAVLVALGDFGVKSFREAAAPALELAQGAPIDSTRAGMLARLGGFFELWPSSEAVFLPGGRPPRTGEVFRQPQLARTIQAMMDAERKALAGGASRREAIGAVRDYFYRGEVARAIDAFMRSNGGLLRYEDMAAFRLKAEEPVTAGFRGLSVHKPGFWSQGPVMAQLLNLLEGYDLRSMGRNSADYIHIVTEAMKLAYADRDAYYGDPLFARVPAARLLSADYASQRRELIGERASMEFRPGRIEGVPALHPAHAEMVRTRIDALLMARDTTCVNAVDREGVMFSSTPSGAWLPSVIAGETGIPLTQRAQSFLLVAGHPNELAGGKRPRITLSPTLVTRGGRPYMALSTPGGDNQDQALLQVLLNVVDFRMDAQQAVEAPRFQTRHLVSSFDNHAMNPGDLRLDERIGPQAALDLRARGHKASAGSRPGNGAAPVMIRLLPDGVIEAGADPFGYRVAQAW